MDAGPRRAMWMPSGGAHEIGGSPIGCLRQPTRRDPSRWPPAKQGVEMGRVGVAAKRWVGVRPDRSCSVELGSARIRAARRRSRSEAPGWSTRRWEAGMEERSSCWGISSGYVLSFLEPALAFPCRRERRSSGWEVRRTPSPAPSRRLPPPLARRRRPGRRHGRIGECCLG
jgi:hypothetical protein